MLFTTFVLVTVDGEHDRLEEGVDFRHGNETTQVGDMTRFGLEKEEQIAIFLSFLVVGEETLLGINSFVEVICNFILLETVSWEPL